MVEVVPLKFGVTFKRVFSQPDIFTAFVKDVVGVSLNISEVHTEYAYPEQVGFVGLKYDLFAEDVEQRVIVEIQHVKEPDFFDRFLYYHLIGLVEQVKSYNAYRFDRTVYTIVVLTSLPKDKSIDFSVAVSDMSPVNERGKTVPIYPHRLVFLAPRVDNSDAPPEIQAWLNLIGDSLDGKVDKQKHDSDLFSRIINQIEKWTVTPDELRHIKDEAAWEDAKAEAKEEGREEGQAELVRTMHSRGISLADIATMTGLTEAQLNAFLHTA